MKNIKTNKIICIFIMILIIICTLTNIALAKIDTGSYKPTDTSGNATFVTAVGKIVGAIRTFGSIMSVAVLIIIGVKYMLASPEGKADYKNTMIPYIVGAIFLFAGSNIAQFIYDVVH